MVVYAPATWAVSFIPPLLVEGREIPRPTESDSISIAEALELRKNIIEDIETVENRTTTAAYCTVIHKEERDITEQPKYSFKDSYEKYLNTVERLRKIENLIHTANHINTVKFKDE